jgi:hypothetical protein
LEKQRASIVAEIDAVRQRFASNGKPSVATKKLKSGRARKPFSPEQRQTMSLAAKRAWAARHARAQSGRSSEAVS